MSVLTDIWNAINAILTAGDVINLVIIAVIAIGAGFMIESMGSLIAATVGALIVFVIASFAREVLQHGANAGQLFDVYWAAFKAMSPLVILAYALIFAILTAIVNLVRSLIFR